MPTPHEIQESLSEAQALVQALAPTAMRLRGQFSMGTRTQWQQSPQLIGACEREATAFFESATDALEKAHGLVYGVELACFPYGITLPLLSDAETSLEDALAACKRAAKSFASIAPAFRKVSGSKDVIVSLWKKLSRDDREVLTKTVAWFEDADGVYGNITLLLSSIPVSAHTQEIQRAMTSPGTEDVITALGTWLRKVPESLRTSVQNMTPSASAPTADTAIWVRDYKLTATGEETWIHDNIEDGVVKSGYILCVRTSLAKKHPDAIAAIGKYLLAEKKHGSGWTRLAHDRLYPWTVPVVTKSYTYFALLPCTVPGKFTVRAKSWSL